MDGSVALKHAITQTRKYVAIGATKLPDCLKQTQVNALQFATPRTRGIAIKEFELAICVDVTDWPQASPEFQRSVEQSGMVRLQ